MKERLGDIDGLARTAERRADDEIVRKLEPEYDLRPVRLRFGHVHRRGHPSSDPLTFAVLEHDRTVERRV